VLLWIVAVIALLVALAAWLGLRGLTRRHEQLTKKYWDLRYQFGELKDRIAPAEQVDDAASEHGPGSPAAPTESFIPLSSLKRS